MPSGGGGGGAGISSTGGSSSLVNGNGTLSTAGAGNPFNGAINSLVGMIPGPAGQACHDGRHHAVNPKFIEYLGEHWRQRKKLWSFTALHRRGDRDALNGDVSPGNQLTVGLNAMYNGGNYNLQPWNGPPNYFGGSHGQGNQYINQSVERKGIQISQILSSPGTIYPPVLR
jgi:hypothetical protein